MTFFTKIRHGWRRFRFRVRDRTRRLLRVWWQRWFRVPIELVLKWWIAWISVISAGVLYWFGRQTLVQRSLGDFHINLLVEGIGLFVALAVAWILIERHSQEQNRKIRSGVHRRIYLLRNHACGPITDLVSRLRGDLRYDSTKLGPDYLQHNYHDIRDALGIPDNQAFRPIYSEDSRIETEQSRQMMLWNWIFEQFVQFLDSCRRTISLYGPGLAEYPALLDTLERIQIGVEMEAESWQKYRTELERKQTWREETNRFRMRHGESELERPPPYGDVLPQAAILNMQTLATNLLSLVANVSVILGDWDEIPAERDIGLSGGFFGWPQI